MHQVWFQHYLLPSPQDFQASLDLFVKDQNPLLFYDRISEESTNVLNKNGLLYFEINEKYGMEIVELLERKGFVNIELKKDINDKDRMVKAVWK